MMMFCCRITMCSSIFLVMGSSVERYLAVCRPHHYRHVSTVQYSTVQYSTVEYSTVQYSTVQYDQAL